MGKRKKSSRKPQGPRKREPLATQFTCLFCNHEKAITVKIDKKLGIGQLHCKVCGQKFQSQINYLSAAVDVYSDWIDACENVAQEAAEKDRDFLDDGARGDGLMASAGAGRGRDQDDEIDDEYE